MRPHVTWVNEIRLTSLEDEGGIGTWNSLNGADYYLFHVSTNLVLKVADISKFDQGGDLKFSHFSDPFHIGP